MVPFFLGRTQSINEQAHIIYIDNRITIIFKVLKQEQLNQTLKNIGALKPITQFRYAYC